MKGRHGTGEARPYDFRRPNTLSRDHIRVLQIAYETFARQFSTVLTTGLRAVGQVTLAGIEQLSYDEHIRSLSSPAFLALHSVAPMPGQGIFAMDVRSAMVCVDHVLGGRGTGSQPVRGFTEIESALLRGLVQRILHELTYAFESLTPVAPVINALEGNPQFAQIAGPSDVMAVAMFDVRIDEHETTASLCLPLTPLLPALEAALAKGGRGPAVGDALVEAQLHDRMREVPVDVSVRFAPVSVSSATLLDLRVGDVLPLRHPLSDPLNILAADTHCAYAVPGAHGKHMAVQIVDPITAGARP